MIIFSDCPTSYARHGTYCYFLSNVQSKKDEAKTACAEHAKKWGGIAHLAQPSTPEKYYFLRHVMMRLITTLISYSYKPFAFK